ncbi:MAG: hypothetical protein NT045_07455, partial [Candidatus Aureabacteria bacterium]|nr:hypothetical protein [Candidatus Auribacterota bacterium]
PPCRYFGACGGCQLQHLAYRAQLEWKSRQVLDLLARIGGVREIPQPVPIPSPNPYSYRSTIRVHRSGGMPPAYGYYSRDSRTIIPVKECLIASPPVNQALAALGRGVDRKRTPEEITIRETSGGKAVIHQARGETNLLSERLYGKDFTVHPGSFFQINRAVAESLTGEIAAAVGTGRHGTLFDLYCGAGVFSALLGERFGRVVGIDSDGRAVACAVCNTGGAEMRHTRFMCGRAEALLPGLYDAEALPGSVLLLDPPRTGVERSLVEYFATLDARAGMIVYVSCNPATLARDLKLLCGSGEWRLERLAVLDMFPQTAHIEVCCTLKKCKLVIRRNV